MKIHIFLSLVMELGLRWMSAGGSDINPENNIYSMDSCNMELVNITCPSEVTTSDPKVILIKEAKYGRMQLGRCVQRDLGYLGCSDDATSILDSRCSGRSDCTFTLPDSQLHSLKSCPADVTPYLHIQFTCVPVIPRKSSTCFSSENTNVSKETRYLSNFVAGSTGDIHANNNNNNNNNRREYKPGEEEEQRCYFVIEGDHGQQINITLFNFFDTKEFSRKSNSSQSPKSEIQPPVFSYSPNYQDVQGISPLGDARGRFGRRALEGGRKEEEKEDGGQNETHDEILFDGSNNLTGKSPKSNLQLSEKSLEGSLTNGKTDVAVEGNKRSDHFPQMLAQVGSVFAHKPELHHHHLQKARICIEVAYAKELQADKIAVNSRTKRNVTKEGVQFVGVSHCTPPTIGTYSPGPRQRRRMRRGVERKSISICEDDPRVLHVLLTKSHRVAVELRHQPQLLRSRQGTFMLRFQAVGCKHPAPMPGAWFHRHGDSLVVTCNHSSDVTYRMTCKNGKWFGEMGNCSQNGKSILKLNQKSSKEDYFPFGILIMVVVGVAIGIVVGGMFLCLVVACTKNCSSPTNLHRAAEYQSILVNHSTMSTATTTTASANNKTTTSAEQQKQQNGSRTGTSNWPGVVTDYYPALNQQPTLAMSDYNCFRDAGYADALHQTVTRPADEAACPQDHHQHHRHLLHHHHHHPRHLQDQLTLYPKCCGFNPDGLFDENLLLCDVQSMDCRQPLSKDGVVATTVTTKSLTSPSASIQSTRVTPFKTFKNPFLNPKSVNLEGKIFGTKTTTTTQVGANPESLLGEEQQCCLGCRESARGPTATTHGENQCSLCSAKDDADRKHEAAFFPIPFHLRNESLKPDLTQLNN